MGSPQEVTEKILFQHEIFGHERFLVQFSVGTLPHDKLMRSIELFGTEVAPAVRAEVAAPAGHDRVGRGLVGLLVTWCVKCRAAVRVPTFREGPLPGRTRT